MDTITETRAPRVDWSPVAETMMEQMPGADQAAIRAAVAAITSQFDPNRMTLIEAERKNERPFYVLPVEARLLVFIERHAEDHFRVIDALRPEQRDTWRDTSDPHREDRRQANARV